MKHERFSSSSSQGHNPSTRATRAFVPPTFARSRRLKRSQIPARLFGFSIHRPTWIPGVRHAYPDLGHDGWDQAYSGSRGDDIYTWMLGFSKP